MTLMTKRLIGAGAIGASISVVGHPVWSWQFWVLFIPAIVYGAICGGLFSESRTKQSKGEDANMTSANYPPTREEWENLKLVADSALAIGSFDHLAYLKNLSDPWWTLHCAVKVLRESQEPRKEQA